MKQTPSGRKRDIARGKSFSYCPNHFAFKTPRSPHVVEPVYRATTKGAKKKRKASGKLGQTPTENLPASRKEGGISTLLPKYHWNSHSSIIGAPSTILPTTRGGILFYLHSGAP